jgi:MFS family permease
VSAGNNVVGVVAPRERPSERYAWYVVFVLIAAYISSFLDRQILSLLVEPIRQDLQITDLQISLLQGFAFAVFYSLCVLPAGWLVDHFSRKNVLAAGLALWCLMTVACGFAASFGELFAARMAVGLGEAVLGPAAFALITSYFSRERLPIAMSVYSIGGSLGAGMAYMFGAVAAHFAARESIDIPFLRDHAPWQVAFMIVGAPGLLVTVLVLLIREPPRATAPAIRAQGVTPFLKDNARFLAVYALGIGLLTSVSYANMAWSPTMFLRLHGWDTGYTARWLGAIMLVFGTAGILAGGYWAVRMRMRHADGTLRTAMLIAFLLTPLTICAPLLSNPWLSLAAYVPTIFLSTSFVSLGPTSIQLIAPDAIRGRINGITLMAVSLVGISIGPFLVALITDAVFGEPKAIDAGLAIGSGLLALASGVFLFLSLKPFRRALDACTPSS